MIAVPESDPGLFLRYWNMPEETAKYRHDGYFFTGDYAKIDEDGYLWFLGRKDDIIKSFGYRVSPYEVERVLKSHPAVADCACVGEEIEKDKLIVVAYVIAQPGAEVSADVLHQYGLKHLAGYKAPKRIYLAKDALTRADHFAAMESRLPAFMAIRERWDPERRIRSAQSVRLLGW